jgi:hypothetical protein
MAAMRALVIVGVAACAAPQPASPPLANESRKTATASSMCFQEPARGEWRPVRWVELDPAKHTMPLRVTSSGDDDADLAFIVDGDTVSTAPSERVHVTGKLYGEPWKWTAWTLTVHGSQTTTTLTAAGMQVGSRFFPARPCPDKSLIDI